MATGAWQLGLLSLVVMATTMCLCDRKEPENPQTKERLDVLTNEIRKLKKDMKKCKAGQLSSLKADDEFPIQILLARREYLPDGNVQYTVRYKVKANDTQWSKPKWILYRYSVKVSENVTEDLPSGVFEASAVVQAVNHTNVYFMMAYGEQELMLYLRNEEFGEDLEETDIQLPALEFSPKGDLVYKQGQNLTVEMTVPSNPERLSPGSNVPTRAFSIRYLVLNPGETALMRMVLTRGDDKFINNEKKVKYLDHSEIEGELNTEKYPVVGIISFNTGSNKKTGLVARAELTRHVVLRPSTQPGPFPAGHLYTVFEEYKFGNANGIVQKYCNYGESCDMMCVVFGVNIETLTLQRTSNGSTHQVNFTSTDEDVKNNYWRTGTYEVHSSIQDTSPTTFTCLASSKEGAQLVYSTEFVFGEKVEIMTNESSVKRFDNGTGLITCTAKGTPLPVITINCSDRNIKEDDPEVVSRTELADDVITVTVFCDRAQIWSWLTCNAENNFTSDYFYFEK